MARLSGNLADQHPLRWVEFLESHTPYEWAVQVAAAEVEPFGEDRDDERAALNTEYLTLKDIPDVAESVRSDAWQKLRNYAHPDAGNDQNELPADPEILAKLTNG